MMEYSHNLIAVEELYDAGRDLERQLASFGESLDLLSATFRRTGYDRPMADLVSGLAQRYGAVGPDVRHKLESIGDSVAGAYQGLRSGEAWLGIDQNDADIYYDFHPGGGGTGS